MPVSLRLQVITKEFRAGVRALDGVSLSLGAGQRLAVIGPSGAGKSTLLRIIAGLEQPTSGRVALGDHDVAKLPPWRRRVAWLGQSAVLLPHMNVRRNLTFGRRADSRESSRRVDLVAEQLNIRALLNRDPRTLSGGERQRVALGRALLAEPDVVLLDEPLASLEPALRSELRALLVQTLIEQGLTAILVTHDVTDALNFGMKMAVMIKGRIVDCDKPERVYASPARRAVATFLGDPPMNLFPCVIVTSRSVAGVHLITDPQIAARAPSNPRSSERCANSVPIGHWALPGGMGTTDGQTMGSLAVWPHHMHWRSAEASVPNKLRLPAMLVRAETRGGHRLGYVRVGEQDCWALIESDFDVPPASSGFVEIDLASCVIYSDEGRLCDQRQYLTDRTIK